jgi:tungstate transport system permease protein
VFSVRGPLGSLQLIYTRRAVFVAQAILALPFVVALSAAALQGTAPGLLAQARALGASRAQVARLALREARIGVLAGIIAALGTSLSEVAAIAILGGNIYGYDQTLASASLYEVNGARYTDAVAIGIVLLLLILILMGALGIVQQRTGAIRLRFRTAT